jgi:4-nitrophenyl phosphatase
MQRMVIFDLDGVIYRGLEPVPGARQLVAALHAAGTLVRFATNNSMATRDAYVARLAGMRIPSAVDEIVTSTSATIDYLRAHMPEVRSVLAVGAAGMVVELANAGFVVTHVSGAIPPGYDGGPLPDAYDAVVAGLDPEFDYRRLAVASTAIRAGARFIATNADQRYPTAAGVLPGAGAIVAAIHAASGVEPLVIGKPEPGMFLAILERAGVAPADAVAIGDNPDADMVAARRAGIRSILVLTGVTGIAAARGLAGERRPDVVAAGPSEVAAALGIPVT